MDSVRDYLRPGKLPHIWCPGCGDGTLTAALARAIGKAGFDRDKVILFTGIGCSSRVNNILDFHSVQTTHGRAVAFATGFKIARPDMKVVCVVGDGDGSGIGGNHLIHAARRNLDMTVVLLNNSIFGMTGGQFSPLTPNGKLATTAPYGNTEYPFDVCRMLEAAGATYVAKSTVYHIAQTESLLEKALTHKGFSYVEVVTQCPTCYGKRNKPSDPYDMLMWQKEHAVPIQQARDLPPQELGDRFAVGEYLCRTDRREFCEAYEELRARLRPGSEGGV